MFLQKWIIRFIYTGNSQEIICFDEKFMLDVIVRICSMS